ncbi:hypothetical protein KIN20_002605 [Parelaphostrongylus tenuis]|uniref:Uncharacterized protein n=1 Tax=Parelaphostrongylus tenuis TaxID=148309 RepID=A0AAD5LYT2_PARTN|nr:hypothetical protein KIN20_002605 [Parelaphostrongylus tenuis]
MSREKDWEALGEEDWEPFEDEELETMLQGLAVSAEECMVTNQTRAWTKTCTLSKVLRMTTGTDSEQRAPLNVDILVGDRAPNVQPPTVLPFDGTAAA